MIAWTSASLEPDVIYQGVASAAAVLLVDSSMLERRPPCKTEAPPCPPLLCSHGVQVSLDNGKSGVAPQTGFRQAPKKAPSEDTIHQSASQWAGTWVSDIDQFQWADPASSRLVRYDHFPVGLDCECIKGRFTARLKATAVLNSICGVREFIQCTHARYM